MRQVFNAAALSGAILFAAGLLAALPVSAHNHPAPSDPVIDPSAPMTRWHGTMIEIGLRPLASPTAREPFGWPIALAVSP